MVVIAVFISLLSVTWAFVCLTLISYQTVQIYNIHGGGKCLGLFILVVCSSATDQEHWPPFPPPMVSTRKPLRLYLTHSQCSNNPNESWWQRSICERWIDYFFLCLSFFLNFSQVTSAISQTGPHLGNWPKRFDKCVCGWMCVCVCVWDIKINMI